jgi:hypothetical protein
VPVLVSLTELKTYLGDAPASSDDALLTQLLNDVEAQFASECGRTIDSFVDEDSAVEVHDGTGTCDLYLSYPVAEDGLESITLGYDSASPDETLDATDKTVIVYGAGSRRITRVDGGVFGRSGQRRYVEVTYDHQADLPADAKQAIKSVASSVYRNRGSEGMKSETVGNFYSYTRDDTQIAASADSFWRSAIAANARGQLV